jgi:hypothetical protein
VAACARVLPTLGSKAGLGEGFQGRIACLAAGRRCGPGLCADSKSEPSGGKSATYPEDVLFYGVVSAQTERVVEFFLEWKAAEAMIGDVREDDPLLADDLRVEAIEL